MTDAEETAKLLKDRLVTEIAKISCERGEKPHPLILQGVLLEMLNECNDLLLEEAGFPELSGRPKE